MRWISQVCLGVLKLSIILSLGRQTNDPRFLAAVQERFPRLGQELAAQVECEYSGFGDDHVT